MINYRIRQTQVNNFIVEMEVPLPMNWLPWRKHQMQWISCSRFGGRPGSGELYHLFPIHQYKTLAEASAAVKGFQRGSLYHYPNGITTTESQEEFNRFGLPKIDWPEGPPPMPPVKKSRNELAKELARGKFYASPEVLGVIEGITDHAGRAFYQPASEGREATLFGFPIKFSKRPPSATTKKEGAAK